LTPVQQFLLQMCIMVPHCFLVNGHFHDLLYGTEQKIQKASCSQIAHYAYGYALFLDFPSLRFQSRKLLDYHALALYDEVS
ncbi:hypothetical protein PMAYCL1PPCAC_31674, partial [Pristionchus mayeri]